MDIRARQPVDDAIDDRRAQAAEPGAGNHLANHDMLDRRVSRSLNHSGGYISSTKYDEGAAQLRCQRPEPLDFGGKRCVDVERRALQRHHIARLALFGSALCWTR